MGSRGGSISFLGTKRHHDKWLQVTEDLKIQGCFAMTELGHGSNVSNSSAFVLEFFSVDFSRMFRVMEDY